MKKRSCICCGTQIEECMGFVITRDILSFFEGIISGEQIREACGKCVLGHENSILSQLGPA